MTKAGSTNSPEINAPEPDVKVPEDGSQVSGQASGYDLVLFVSTLMLAGFGLVMVYSASAFMSFTRYGSDTLFAKRQAAYFLIGLVAMYIGARVDYRRYGKLAYPLLGAAFVLLVLVLVPGIGSRVAGARRWFRIGGVSFQPAEFAKLALAIFLAVSAARKAGKIDTFSVGFLPHVLVAGAMLVLVLAQPDLGTAMLLMGLTFVVLFIAGTRLLYILMAVLAVAPVAWWAIVGTPWRFQRMVAFFEPEAHRSGAGYQIYESLITIGSGGWTGMGLGEGRQKLLFLPEGHTDFILPVIGQELGFLGVVFVVVLIGVVLWRGTRIAIKAGDLFGTHLAFALTSLLVIEALINMGVVMALMPTKGLTLPLVSYGGSSLVMTMYSIGVLMNISKRNPVPASPASWKKARRLQIKEAVSLRKWAFSGNADLPVTAGKWTRGRQR